MGHGDNVQSKIPTFTSREEEAEFWDTHSFADFEDEFEPVEVEVVTPLRHGLRVSFESAEFHRLVAFAKAHGVGPAALSRTWVLEALARAEATTRDEPERAAVG